MASNVKGLSFKDWWDKTNDEWADDMAIARAAFEAGKEQRIPSVLNLEGDVADDLFKHIHQVEVIDFTPIQWDPRLGFDKVAEALAQAQGEFEPITLDKVGKTSWDKNYPI